MKINIGEMSKQLGVSIRTLRYYDEIGLLTPSEITEAGYRLYDASAQGRMQEILFYRSLGFSLAEVGAILSSPSYDRDGALHKRLELLMLERKRLDETIETVKNVIKGEKSMKNENKAAREYDAAKAKYASEVKEKWGKTEAYKQSEEKSAALSDSGKADFMSGSEEIFAAFAAARELSPASPEAQALVARWQQFITDNCYECTKPILQGLGLMYTGDERFTQSLDSFGEGTAQFMSAAIAEYCK